MLATISCGEKNSNISYTVYDSDSIQHIDLNQCLKNSEYYVSDILESVKIVCLETNENSLLASIAKIIVTEDRIFIRDLYMGGGVAIFDNTGKFIKRLVNGNGPGEVQIIQDLNYDKFTNELVIIDNHQLKKYDKDGNFKENILLKYPCGYLISCNQNGYLFSNVYGCESDISTLTNYCVLNVDRNYDVKQLLLPFSESAKIVPASAKAIEYNDNTLISVSFCDTIYKYKNDSLRPYMTIDYSSVKLDIEQFTSMQDYFEKVLISNDRSKADFKGQFYENSTHQIMALAFASYVYSIFIDKKTNNIQSGIYCTYDDDKGVNIIAPAGVYNDWFYEVCNASDFKHNVITSNEFISQEDLAKLESLKEDDNPYLVFYKLKQF